jgi:hypothetical protein
MRKRWKLVAILLLVGMAGTVVPRLWRGASGPSSLYGGTLEPTTISDFPSFVPERWINGGPFSLQASRGSVVLIEAWHPT